MNFESTAISGHNNSVYAVIPGISGSTFFTGSGDGYVAEWNLEKAVQEKFAVKTEGAVFSILLIPNKPWLLIAAANGSIHCIDLGVKQEKRHLSLHKAPVYHMSWIPQTKHVVMAGGDGVLSIWDDEHFELIRTIPLGEMKLRKIAADREGSHLAVACGDGIVRIFDTSFYNEITTISAHEGGAGCLSWHLNKKILVTGGKDGMIKCWHTAEGFRNVLSFPAHNTAIYSLGISGSGEMIASCSLDKSVKIWESSSFEILKKIDHSNGGHSRSVNDLCWMGENLITVGDDRKIIVTRPIQ